MWILSKENEDIIAEWNKRWIEDVVLRTKPMTPQDKLEVEKAIREIYRLSDFDGDNLNVVFVRSPMEARLLAAAEHQKCVNTIPNYHYSAENTYAYKLALQDIIDTTHQYARQCARDDNTHGVFRPDFAIYDATYGSIDATYGFTYGAIHRATYIDKLDIVVDRLRNAGNLESSKCSYVSFVRDIIGFKCEEHKNYKHYETCTKLSGPRYMHPKFCIISDFPTELHNYTINGRLVAHNDKGPSHLWADGFAIWTIHGIAVTEKIVMRPETLTINQIDEEKNEEVKRVMIERFTWARYLTETNAKCLDARTNDVDGTSEALMALKDSSVRLLCACKSTARVYAIGVDKKIKTCQKAQSWMAGGKKINVIGVS